jgi:hypothetical protein
MATSAKAPGDRPRPGKARLSASPVKAPNDELMMRIGARVPPDVPDASAIHQMTSLPTARAARVVRARRLARVSLMTS